MVPRSKRKANGRDAYHRAGIKAKATGFTRDSNPYTKGTMQHAHWRAGWDAKPRKRIDKNPDSGII